MRIKAVILEGPADAATIAAIRAALDGQDQSIVFAPLTVRDIAKSVGFEMGVSIAAIVGERRDRAVFRARAATTWLATELTQRSAEQIGRAMGDRDHSTVIHQRRRAAELRDCDPAFRSLTDRLFAKFREAAEFGEAGQ